MTATVHTEELEAKVEDMYRHVAHARGVPRGPASRHSSLTTPSVDCVISNQARNAGVEYGVESISPLVTKTAG